MRVYPEVWTEVRGRSVLGHGVHMGNDSTEGSSSGEMLDAKNNLLECR